MTKEELKTMHKLIKKVTYDIEHFSFNTSVSAFMVALNELSSQKSTNAEAMEIFTRLIAPFAPHIAEEFWHGLGHEGSVVDAEWPEYNEEYLKEDMVKYPVSFNGKTRFMLEVAADASKADVEVAALAAPEAGNGSTERPQEGDSRARTYREHRAVINIMLKYALAFLRRRGGECFIRLKLWKSTRWCRRHSAICVSVDIGSCVDS